MLHSTITKKFGIAVLIILCLAARRVNGESALWQKVSDGSNENTVNCVRVHPQDSRRIFAGTPQALYVSRDQGKSFQSFFQSQSSQKAVNAVFVDLAAPTSIYLAADSGLFVSANDGEAWEEIYGPGDPALRKCLAVIVSDGVVYAATAGGLFYKSLDEGQWNQASGDLGRKPVYVLAQDARYVYAATSNGLYRLEKSSHEKERIFTARTQEITTLDQVAEDDDLLPVPRIKDVVVTSGPSSKIILAAENGIFVSLDHGDSWDRYITQGLPLKSVTSLVVINAAAPGDDPNPGKSHDRIYVGTTQGIYRQAGRRWERFYQGLETNRVVRMTMAGDGTVYAATGQGLFVKTAALESQDVDMPSEDVLRQFESEPSVTEVQRLAVEYANLNPQQIRAWHKAARNRAFLPTVSLGLDRADTELYHWDTGANPDLLVRGRDYLDWDVSVSWNLGDLIWVDDHTSIDSRSKLMSELREDVLDQVTRLYFERRRIQVELATSADLGPKGILEKEMRIEELTALLDALTGGEFSKRFMTNGGTR